MINYDLNYLEEITGFSKPDRDELRKFHAGLTEYEQIEIAKMTNNFYVKRRAQLLKSPDKKSEANYAAFLSALKQLMQIYNSQHRKSSTINAADKKLICESAIAKLKERKNKSTAPLRTSIERHYIEINRVRTEHNLSYRELIEYLKSTHRAEFKTITAQYLRQVFLDIQDRRTKQAENFD